MVRKFREYDGLDLIRIDSEVLSYWNEHGIFQKSIDFREEGSCFVFFEGPPSANGVPGIHHVLGRTIKDIYCRFNTMKGFKVMRKAGWDTHGLPVELSVEKELGITKEDIGRKISIENYNHACKEVVLKYTAIWNDLTARIGCWVDMQDPYITYKSKYIETVWWLLSQIYKKKLLYKGYKIQPYSPKAGTGLSTHELNQPGCYKEVMDTTIIVQFRAERETVPQRLQKYDNVYFLAWTTTPWTLPSNTALTVGPAIEYVLVRTYNQYTFEAINVFLAKKLISKHFKGKYLAVETEEDLKCYQKTDKKIPFFVLDCIFTGRDLEGIRYEQLLPWAVPFENAENAFRVISGDFVTTEDGTGIVHTAPTFGVDDALVAKNAVPEVPPMLVLDDDENLVPLVDFQGRFIKQLAHHGGKYVKNEYYENGKAPDKSVDVEISIHLKETNKAFHVEKYLHSYPHCWRTDKPILYYPLDSWFVKVSAMRDRMTELNRLINWKPEHIGTGRFGNWLKNASDWNLSRSRYWGIPLPIWRTEDGTEEIVIESVSQLKEEIEKAGHSGIENPDSFDHFFVGNFSDDNYDRIDLHKNTVDEITLVSPGGKPMKRESDLIDVWFDSGAMPYAQHHYPFENKSLIDDRLFYPADFIAEGVDQTRGWFYTMHVISVIVFDELAYKSAISNGLVLDKYGKKMSKRWKNAVDPFMTIEKYGADATRWYMISNSNPWDDLKFDEEGIDEVRRKFFGTLYNIYSFFALYANIDGFKYEEDEVELSERSEMDRWILSELNTLIQKVDQFYKAYEATKATREIQYFVVENLSNWFVRLNRRRFWKGEYQIDKISAYQTLHTLLSTVAKLAAPVAPFFMDNLYKDLISVIEKDAVASVHLADFPKSDVVFINGKLESKMQKAQQISSMVLSLRKKERIKVRQPLQNIMVSVLNDEYRSDIRAVKDLILSEVNVKEMKLLDDTSEILVKCVKPNFKILGPRFGKDMKSLVSQLEKLSQKDIFEFELKRKIDVRIGEDLVILSLDEVEVVSKDIEGFSVMNYKGITVALDIDISSSLKSEGIARELVNRVQKFRKDSQLEVFDRIKLSILFDKELKDAVDRNKAYICTETLTSELKFVPSLDEGLNIEFDDIKTKIAIKKLEHQDLGR